MKKFIMAMAAVAMLCAGLASCSSDIDEIIENETPKQEITFDFNFSAAGDAETRATQKTAWAAGDVIYVGFKDQKGGLLKFTYDGANWSEPTTIGTLNLETVASSSSKYCFAFWVEENPGDDDLELDESGYWYRFARNGQSVLIHTNVTYNYEADTKKISANFTLQRDKNSLKIAVSGLGDDTWQICAKELQYFTFVKFWGVNSIYYGYTAQDGRSKAFNGGYKNNLSETSFFVRLNTSVTSRDAGSVIYLKNTKTEKIYRKLFSGKKLSTMGGKTINITFSESTWSEISAEDFAALTSSNMDVIAAPTTGTLNGHTWVDLGLPSGTKWATCNVGADSPTAYGDYFAWGETTFKDGYNSSTSVTYNKTIDELKTAGIIDDNNTLTAAYDAATVNWGTGWRMPTSAELQELVDNCTWTWKGIGNTDYHGLVGYEVKSNTNDNSIFLRAAAYYKDFTFKNATYNGRYWSSSADSETTNYSFYLYLSVDEYEITSSAVRYYGQTIRPVTK